MKRIMLDKSIFNSFVGIASSGIVMRSGYMHKIDLYTNIIIMLLTAYATYRSLPLLISGKWKIYAPTIQHRIIFILIILYAAFASVYNQIIMSSIPNTIDSSALYIYILSVLIWFFLGIAFLEGIERLQKKFVTSIDHYVYFDKYEIITLWLKIFCIIMIGYSFWVIACFPANMSSDSGDIWKQAIGESPLHNWHPIVYTLLIRISIFFAKSPFMIVFGQTVIQAAIWATASVFLLRIGLSVVLVYGMALFVAFSPNNGIMTMTMWKDVVYAVSILALALSSAKIITNMHQTPIQNFLLIVALVIMGSVRHNGIVPAVVTATVICIFYFQGKKRYVPISAIMIIIVINTVTSQISHTQNVSTSNTVTSALLAHITGSVFYHSGHISDEIKYQLIKEIPETKWISDYNPFTFDGYIFSNIKPQVVNAVKKMKLQEKITLYSELLHKNFIIVLRHYLDTSSINWQVFYGADPKYYTARYCFDITNLVNFKQYNSAVKNTADSILSAGTSLYIFDSIFWKTGIYVIIFLFLMYFSWIKKVFKINIVLLPAIVNFILLIVLTPVQDYRYTYQIYLIFPFIFLFFLCITANCNKFSCCDIQ
jgi:hypothetical protein